MVDRNALLASMLEAVSATTVDRRLLERVLAEIVQSGPWTHGVFWFVDHGDAGAMHAVAAVAPDDDPCRGAFAERVGRRPVAPGQGLAGRAHRARHTSEAERPRADERFDDLDCQPVAALAHPIVVAERVVAVLEVLAVVGRDGIDDPPDVAEWRDGPLENVSPALGHLFDRYRDRALAEAAEGRLAAVLDAGDLGVATFDRRVHQARWSARMAAHHGIGAADGVGTDRDLFARVDPEDLGSLEQAIVGVSAVAGNGDGPTTVDYRIRDEGGGTRWLTTRISVPDIGADRMVTALVSADVTAQRILEAEHRRRRHAVEGLQWVTQAVLGGRDLDESVDALVRAATSVLGADFGVLVHRRPQDTGERIDWTHTGAVDGGEPPSTVNLDGFADTDAPVRIDLGAAGAVQDALASWALPVDLAGMGAVLVAPVRGEDATPLGTMVFLHPERDYFTDDDVDLANSIARSAGVVIDNEHHHEEQRIAADAFQRALLPRGDLAVAGAEVCVRYHPGRDGLEVGGDWFDVIPLDEHRVGLAVGDVCGHGVSAAAAMGQLRFSFRAMVQTSTPEQAFSMLNRMAIEELQTTLTLVYVEVDTRTGEMRVWSAGHLPPVCASPEHTAPAERPGGPEVAFLGTDEDRGPMLGFVDEIEVRGTAGHLAPGHTLLLYSDGLIERRGESISDGLERLAASFVGRSSEIEDLCDELYDLLADVGPTADDTALLAFRRL